MSTDIVTTNPESRQIEAMSRMDEGMTLLRLENEQIFALAKASPREPAAIVKQLSELIEAYPAAAAGAIYSKPVGTVQEVTCGECSIKYQVQKVDGDTCCIACDSKEKKNIRKVKKFAEGLSIRAAETIRSVYGYTRLATKTELIEDDKARITGTIVDYAAGNITSDERIISPLYKAHDGKMTRTPEDRFLNVLVKAEKSKLRRDIILDNTPAIVKTAYRDMCEAKAGILVTPQEIEQKIIPAFAAFGITPQHLDRIIGKPRCEGWTEEERLQLRKILVGLKQEEFTLRELLEGLDRPESTAKVPNAGASINDLAKPAETKTNGEKKVTVTVVDEASLAKHAAQKTTATTATPAPNDIIEVDPATMKPQTNPPKAAAKSEPAKDFKEAYSRNLHYVNTYKAEIEGCKTLTQAVNVSRMAMNDSEMVRECQPETVTYIREFVEGNLAKWNGIDASKPKAEPKPEAAKKEPPKEPEKKPDWPMLDNGKIDWAKARPDQRLAFTLFQIDYIVSRESDPVRSLESLEKIESFITTNKPKKHLTEKGYSEFAEKIAAAKKNAVKPTLPPTMTGDEVNSLNGLDGLLADADTDDKVSQIAKAWDEEKGVSNLSEACYDQGIKVIEAKRATVSNNAASAALNY